MPLEKTLQVRRDFYVAIRFVQERGLHTPDPVGARLTKRQARALPPFTLPGSLTRSIGRKSQNMSQRRQEEMSEYI